MMQRYLLLLFATLGLTVRAQNDSLGDGMRSQYEQFRRQAHRQYDDFRDEANRLYAEFMKEAWQRYEAKPAIPKPKDEMVPPVVMPEEDWDKPVEDNPVTIEEVVEPVRPEPQPVPVAPIREVPQPVEAHVAFMFYGTECKVRFGDENWFTVGDCGDGTLAAVWQRLSGEEYNNLIRDCLELRVRLQLCDWAYLNMLCGMAEKCLGRGNEATMLAAYVYCQSGYRMRLGRAGTGLRLLYASEHNIYSRPYFLIDNERYYIFGGNDARLEICDVAYPKERSLSLLMTQTQKLSCNKSEMRTLQSERYPEVKAQVCVNRNLIDFYNTYPISDMGGDFMTRWAMYANTPLEDGAKEGLYPALMAQTKGLGKKDAVERLLNFVQTAFVYEYDDKVWGQDRAFFSEETLYYPYCDCEDRSILFSRLVRDLLGLDVLLVYYPGHLATAVCFDEDVAGDYIQLGGRRFTVCDPTYIGAGVGRTMPGMDNAGAKVIKVEG